MSSNTYKSPNQSRPLDSVKPFIKVNGPLRFHQVGFFPPIHSPPKCSHPFADSLHPEATHTASPSPHSSPHTHTHTHTCLRAGMPYMKAEAHA